MKKIGVVLGGCGVYDGSEIHEAVITLLAIARNGAQAVCFAPDKPQRDVINHLTGEAMPEQRNVLVEAARIARGDILPLAQAREETLDALIVPGGFGAAKNLSDFAFKGASCTVQSDVLRAARGFAAAHKPVGLMCIAPAMAARIFGAGVQCTIGHDPDTAATLGSMGAEHVDCAVDEIVVDAQHKLVTTPAYMLAKTLAEAASGINKLVDRVLELA